MTDFLDRLERQLVERARQGVSRPARVRWSRRTLVFAAIAAVTLLGVPAAAVTGVFSGSGGHHRLPAGPGLVDINPPCRAKNTPQGHTTTDPPPAEILQSFGIFRRPQVASDKLPKDRLGLFMTDGVNPGYVRRAKSSSGLHVYLIPSQNVTYRPALEGPGCERFAQPEMEATPGICMRLGYSGGAGGCGPVDGILAGKQLMTEGGSNHGGTLAAGIVPDGVTEVIWRVRRGTGFLDTRIRVRDNVYAGRFPGRHGHGLYVYFVDAKGKHLVIGPARVTKKQRADQQRDARLDAQAGPTPTVYPATGDGRAVFTLRMRVRHVTGRYVYAVTVTGRRPGACDKPYRYRIGMVPGAKGADRGLMRAFFGAGPSYTHWCSGTYHGTVRRQVGTSSRPSGPVVGRFQFTVR